MLLGFWVLTFDIKIGNYVSMRNSSLYKSSL